MKKKVTISILVASILVAVAILGVAGYRSAHAASDNDEIARRIVLPPVPDLPFDGPQDEYLADALGITVEELDAARETARLAAIDKAVEEGLITQAQADDMKDGESVFPFGRLWFGWLAEKSIDYQSHLADALGISVEELQAAHLKAFEARIDQNVADGDLTEEEAEYIKARNALYSNDKFQAALKSSFEAAVQQAVADGILTQEQADQILEERDDKPFGGMWGFERMKRGTRMHLQFGEGGRMRFRFSMPDFPHIEISPSFGDGF